MISHNRILVGKMLLLLIILLSGLTFCGCAGIKSTPEGGSGVVVANGTLYLCPTLKSGGGFGCAAPPTTGKLVAVNASDGSYLWEVLLETSRPAGGFGCAAPPAPVAIYGTPAVAGGLVYVGGYSGRIHAINFSLGKPGEPTWEYPPKGEKPLQPIIGGSVVAWDKVYFGCSDGKVYALDAADGHKVCEFPTGDKIWSTPAIKGETLYIGSLDKKLYALNTADLSKKWEPFETGGAIVSTPLVYNNTVYIGSFDRHLYAVDATDGSLIWKCMAENWFWARPVICNNTIYAGCLDDKVYILNAESGEELVAPIDLGSPIASSPVLVDDKVVIATEEGKIYTIDTGSNGKEPLADLEAKVYAPLCASDGLVYIHTQEGALYEVNVNTGARRNLPLGSK